MCWNIYIIKKQALSKIKMAKGNFTILSTVQEVEISELDIRGSSDSLNSILQIPLTIKVRMPRREM